MPDGGADRTRRLVRLSFRSSPGPCRLPCWKQYGVEAERMLVLADAEGEERFTLTEAEYDEVRTLAESPEFERAIEEDTVEGGACNEGTLDSNVSISVEFEGDPPIEPELDIVGCLGPPPGADPERGYHVFNRIKWLIAALRDRYLDCPPYEPAPPDWAPGNGVPYVRDLCVDPCGGNCPVVPF